MPSNTKHPESDLSSGTVITFHSRGCSPLSASGAQEAVLNQKCVTTKNDGSVLSSFHSSVIDVLTAHSSMHPLLYPLHALSLGGISSSARGDVSARLSIRVVSKRKGTYQALGQWNDVFDFQLTQGSDVGKSFEDGAVQEIVPLSSQGGCQRHHQGVWAATILQTMEGHILANGSGPPLSPPPLTTEKDQFNTMKRSLMGVWLTSHNASTEKEDIVQRWMASVIPVDDTSI